MCDSGITPPFGCETGRAIDTASQRYMQAATKTTTGATWVPPPGGAPHASNPHVEPLTSEDAASACAYCCQCGRCTQLWQRPHAPLNTTSFIISNHERALKNAAAASEVGSLASGATGTTGRDSDQDDDMELLDVTLDPTASFEWPGLDNMLQVGGVDRDDDMSSEAMGTPESPHGK